MYYHAEQDFGTPSTGELAFLNDTMSVFKLQVDKEGNLSAIDEKMEVKF